MILSAQSIRRAGIIHPFHERTVAFGMSYGLSACSYDARIDQNLVLPRGGFVLASTIEYLSLPDWIEGEVKDKSSWARQGLSCYNTLIDPGFTGYITLELTNNGPETLRISGGMPICQLKFSLLDEPTDLPYRGKYQNQPNWPVEWIAET